MKNKLVLDFVFGNEFTLIGIACHLKDYRFCWLLNNHLTINLRKIKDFSPDQNDTEQAFSFYYCSDPNRDETFFLLGNHSQGGEILDKYAQTDYFLLIQNLVFPGGSKALVAEIKKITQVLTAFEIDFKKFNEGQNLLSAIEIAFLEYQKEEKKSQKSNS
jgi:hypothetical protein